MSEEVQKTMVTKVPNAHRHKHLRPRVEMASNRSEDEDDEDDDTSTLLVHIVHIPALQRHLAGGWSEDQLLSGRVYTVGRRELEVNVKAVRRRRRRRERRRRRRNNGGGGGDDDDDDDDGKEDATLMDVAEAVEDAWGCDVEDQAYRTAGGVLTLVPGPARRGDERGDEGTMMPGETGEYGLRAALASTHRNRTRREGGGGGGGVDGERTLKSLGTGVPFTPSDLYHHTFWLGNVRLL